MERNTATTTNKEATPEAQNKPEDVHKMTPCPTETGRFWKQSTTKEKMNNKWKIIQSNKTKQTNKEGLSEVHSALLLAVASLCLYPYISASIPSALTSLAHLGPIWICLFFSCFSFSFSLSLSLSLSGGSCFTYSWSYFAYSWASLLRFR